MPLKPPKPMNKLAAALASEMASRAQELGVDVHKIAGATVIDAGVKALGSFEAGIYVSEITMGGLASISISSTLFEDLLLPAVSVSTDYPVEACMASQFAGWRVKVGDFFANGSGPARVLARKPKKLFEELGYVEESDEAVLALETDRLPTEDVVKHLSSETKVKPENLYLVVFATNSIVGVVQTAARIVETGIHKMHTLGFDIKRIRYGYGVAPVAPLHPNMLVTMGLANDLLLYGGSTFYVVDFDDDSKLREVVEKTPSSSSKDYGILLGRKVPEIGIEFLYKVDPGIFAPALVVVNNLRTGTTIRAGRISKEMILRALGLQS